MKTELTTEQSQHLIELGVPKAKANEVIFNPNNDDYDFVFKLTDLLEILPKEIDGLNDITIQHTLHGWHCGYGHCAEYNGFFLATQYCKDELIDSLYELLCWCIENGHLKFD